DFHVTGVQTCALPISRAQAAAARDAEAGIEAQVRMTVFDTVLRARQSRRRGDITASEQLLELAAAAQRIKDARFACGQLQRENRSEERRVGKERRART